MHDADHSHPELAAPAPPAHVPTHLRHAIAVQLAAGDPAGLPFAQLPPGQRLDELRMADWIVRTVNAAGYLVCPPRAFGLRDEAPVSGQSQAQVAARPVVFDKDCAGPVPTIRNILLLVQRARSRTVLFALADALDELAAAIVADGGDAFPIKTMAILSRHEANTLPKEPA